VSGGEVRVSLSLTSFVFDRIDVVIRPGLTYNVELTSYDPNRPDDPPRRVPIQVTVHGAVCPDPGAHAFVCDEDDHDHHGDCDGEVRAYRVHTPVAGKAPGETVLLCVNHAQRHGRHIRKATP
jgi:hypothetical protein